MKKKIMHGKQHFLTWFRYQSFHYGKSFEPRFSSLSENIDFETLSFNVHN